MVAFVAPHGALATVPSDQGTFIVVRLEQSLKELTEIVVGVLLKVIVVRLEHP